MWAPRYKLAHTGRCMHIGSCRAPDFTRSSPLPDHLSTVLKLPCLRRNGCSILLNSIASKQLCSPPALLYKACQAFLHGDGNHILPVINGVEPHKTVAQFQAQNPGGQSGPIKEKSPTPIPRKAKHTFRGQGRRPKAAHSRF